MLIATLLLLTMLALVLFAAASDIATMTIPNWISIAIALAFPAAAFAAGMPVADIGGALLIGAAALAVGFGLFQLRILGGGDVKIIAAAAPWIGAGALGAFLATMAIAGGVLAAALILARAGARPMLHRPRFLNRLLDRRRGAPYGVAIAVATLAVTPFMPIAVAVRESHLALTLL